MRRTEARHGVRMIKFLDLLGRYEAAEFPPVAAAELLGVGERTFRRWRQCFADAGEAGFSTGGWARPPASGFRSTGRPRWKRFTGRGTPASRPSIFTSIWCATTILPGATPGPRRSCIRPSASSGGLTATGRAARRASAQAAAPAAARHDAASRHAWHFGQPALDLIPGSSPIGAKISRCARESFVIPAWDDARIAC
jgi:hypothetical protein